MSLIDLISLHDREPVPPRYREYTSVLASAYGAVEQANDTLPLARRISPDTVRTIVSREPDEAAAFNAVAAYVSTVNNYRTPRPTRHTDLLPAGHPVRGAAERPLVASFFATDPRLPDETTRALVAAAIAAEPDSAARQFNLTRLRLRSTDPQILRMISDADAAVRVEEK